MCVGVLMLGAVVLGEVVLAVSWFCDGGGVFMRHFFHYHFTAPPDFTTGTLSVVNTTFTQARR